MPVFFRILENALLAVIGIVFSPEDFVCQILNVGHNSLDAEVQLVAISLFFISRSCDLECERANGCSKCIEDFLTRHCAVVPLVSDSLRYHVEVT